MAHTTTIHQLRTYLKKWFLASQPPKEFMEKHLYYDVNDINLADIVYQLGKIAYHARVGDDYQGELTHPAILKPRLYQFLNNVLQENLHQRIVEPEILLQLLTAEKKDTIEIQFKNENYEVNGYSTLGVTRTKNQDNIKAFELENKIVVLMVADGMGGGEGGEVASEIVVTHISHYLHSVPIHSSTIEEALRKTIFEAHQKILDYAKEHQFKSMGTTLSLTIIFPNGELFIAHIGDSRIYEMECQGEVRQISEDHSYPEVLFRLGKITQEEKKNYQKNIVVYILGKETLKKEEISIYKSYLYSETDLILCSDGYWDMIQIEKKSFKQPFVELKNEIFQQISKDNVSLIRYQSKKNKLEVKHKVSEYE